MRFTATAPALQAVHFKSAFPMAVFPGPLNDIPAIANTYHRLRSAICRCLGNDPWLLCLRIRMTAKLDTCRKPRTPEIRLAGWIGDLAPGEKGALLTMPKSSESNLRPARSTLLAVALSAAP